MTRDERIDRNLREITQSLRKHGECLVRIDERTLQHEKRMDRQDRKSAALGALTGLLGGFLAAFSKSLFGPPS